jgi:hypothetical protein
MSEIRYRWAILRLRTEPGRIVRDVTFRRSATDGQRSAHVEGTITLPPPAADSVMPYDELTEAQVADWVAGFVDAARLDADLAARLSAASDALDLEELPWATPQVPPAVQMDPVPETISFRQLVLGLLGSGFLTAQQALAAAETRARPPQLDAIIATLPDDAALAARITWATMSEARRADPPFSELIAAGHATAKQVDALFQAAARL